MSLRFRSVVFIGVLFLLATVGQIFAQNATGTLRGLVTDPSGAVIPQATVSAITASGGVKSATTDGKGIYEIPGLAPGTYSITIAAPGFAATQQQGIAVVAGQAKKLDVSLEIAVEQQQVEVKGEANSVDVSSSNNASSMVIKGKDLDALSDDPDQLESDLEALAGPSAGPNGGQIYIDGFSNGQLPPKSAIREIRVNQNPFSPEYDKLGYGRIEILTKPGMDQYHGQFMLMGNSSSFNAPNPFVKDEPDYHTMFYSGNVSGPIISSKASFFLNMERRDINDVSIINGYDPNLANATCVQGSCVFSPLSGSVLNPKVRTSVSPRLDYQISQNNTLIARYQYTKSTNTNGGVGDFSLASMAVDSASTSHNLQLTDTQVISPNVINETRFQFTRDNSNQTPQSLLPSINVPSLFSDGGSTAGLSFDHNNRYELQNFTSFTRGKHLIKVGGRLRASQQSDESTGNFNGSFNYADGNAYALGQWNQFTLAWMPNGKPIFDVNAVDAGLYAQDEWRVRENLTLSYGLRFETQNNIDHHADFAPRFGFAWGVGGGGTPKTVIRGGYGVFYDRVGQNLVLQADRLNGMNVQQILIRPTYTDDTSLPPFTPQSIPDPAQLSQYALTSSIYRISSNLRAPYTMQGAVSVERQINDGSKIAVTYLNSRGVHVLNQENLNAPAWGTFDPDNPISEASNLYEYQSGGIFKQNQLIVNGNTSLGSFVSMFGFYSLSYANANSSGSGDLPAIPGDLNSDWGRASFDVRHRLFLMGTLALPHGFRLNPFFIANSGAPYSIYVPDDLNGDGIIGDDRPGYATTASTRIVQTSLGNFDIRPTGTLVPVNYLTGPGNVSMNLRVSKTFGLGKKVDRGGASSAGGPGGPGGPGGGRHGMGRGMGGGRGPNMWGPAPVNNRYSLTLSASARNLFNNVNLASPVSMIGSPDFGQSIKIAGNQTSNRRIDLQLTFNF